MKIGYDASGNILAVTLDSEQLSAPNILSVTDNNDYLMNPSKYQISAGVPVLRRYMVMTPSATSSPHGTPITISIQAYTSAGVADSAAADTVTISGGPRQNVYGLNSPITLSAGTASFQVNSTSAQSVTMALGTTGAWCAPIQLKFT